MAEYSINSQSYKEIHCIIINRLSKFKTSNNISHPKPQKDGFDSDGEAICIIYELVSSFQVVLQNLKCWFSKEAAMRLKNIWTCTNGGDNLKKMEDEFNIRKFLYCLRNKSSHSYTQILHHVASYGPLIRTPVYVPPLSL